MQAFQSHERDQGQPAAEASVDRQLGAQGKTGENAQGTKILAAVARRGGTSHAVRAKMPGNQPQITDFLLFFEPLGN